MDEEWTLAFLFPVGEVGVVVVVVVVSYKYGKARSQITCSFMTWRSNI